MKARCFCLAFIGVCILIGCEPTDMVHKNEVIAALGQRDQALKVVVDSQIKFESTVKDLESRLDNLEHYGRHNKK